MDGPFEQIMGDTLSLEIAFPGDEIPAQYFDCRYICLRLPLGFEKGAEQLADDCDAIHAWWQDTGDGVIVAVGRIHLIPDQSDGSQSDHAGPGAAICPAFTPLISDQGSLRPAVQIRQMGTREDWRRQGLAGGLVLALEAAAISHWGASTGWLQARTGAIEFYQSEDWESFGEIYDVSGIGPHQSMWKTLDLRAVE